MPAFFSTGASILLDLGVTATAVTAGAPQFPPSEMILEVGINVTTKSTSNGTSLILQLLPASGIQGILVPCTGSCLLFEAKVLARGQLSACYLFPFMLMNSLMLIFILKCVDRLDHQVDSSRQQNSSGSSDRHPSPKR